VKLQIINKKKFQEKEIVEAFVGKVMKINQSKVIIIKGMIIITSIKKYFLQILCDLMLILIKIIKFNLLKTIIIFIITV